MNVTTYLEWFHDGNWHRIGWAGTNEKRTQDLRTHGAALAARGGYYRLVVPSIYRDAPPEVVHNYPLAYPVRGRVG